MHDTCLKFAPGAFQNDLRRRVDDFFERTGAPRRGHPLLWTKVALIAAWGVASYVALVYYATSWATAAPLAVSLGFAMAGVGMNVMHDAGHDAFSTSRTLNRALVRSLDLLGGSSYVWKFRHNVVHHTYPNIDGVDLDPEVGPWARLAPPQGWRPIHRFQHLYMWVLFGLLSFKWFLLDFRVLFARRLGPHAFSPPRGRELALLLAGKLVFLGWTLVLPLTRHGVWAVLAGFSIAYFTLGMVLAVSFQLAHCVAEAERPVAEGDTRRVAREWAALQVETALDFAPRSRLLTLYLGGLNYQIEHHLLPQVCHVHYPALAPIVRAACAEHGVRYSSHGSFPRALAAHYRWMRDLGRPPSTTIDEQHAA